MQSQFLGRLDQLIVFLYSFIIIQFYSCIIHIYINMNILSQNYNIRSIFFCNKSFYNCNHPLIRVNFLTFHLINYQLNLFLKKRHLDFFLGFYLRPFLFILNFLCWDSHCIYINRCRSFYTKNIRNKVWDILIFYNCILNFKILFLLIFLNFHMMGFTWVKI